MTGSGYRHAAGLAILTLMLPGALSAETEGKDAPAAIAQIQEFIAAEPTTRDPADLLDALENAIGIDRALLGRVLVIGTDPSLAAPLGDALARLAQTHRTLQDELTASRIETAIALYGTTELARAFNSAFAQYETPEPPDAGVEQTPPAPHQSDSPVYGFASHGTPMRVMGPTH